MPQIIYLWYHDEEFVQGGFSWVGNSEEIQQWYIHQSSTGGITIGSAFPRFKDYYDIAQTGEYYPDFPAEGGNALKIY